MSFSVQDHSNAPRFGRAAAPLAAKTPDADSTALLIETPPAVTLDRYDKQVKKFADQRNKVPRPFGSPTNNPAGWADYDRALSEINAKQSAISETLLPEIMRGAMRYLPPLSQQNLANYLTSPQLAADWLSPERGPDAVFRKLVMFLGAPVVKYFQTQAQEAANTSDVRAHRQMRKLRRELDDKNGELKWLPVTEKDAPKGTSKEDLKENQKRAKKLKEEADALELQLSSMQRFLPLKSAIMPLLDAVPPAAYEQIKPALDETVADFNKVNAGDPIVQVDRETLGAGSMAQVHRARTQSGRSVIVKVFRPEARKEYLEAYHRFTQFALLFLMGDDKREWAAKLAQTLMDVFKEESDPQREQLHARRLRARMQREKLPIKIPQVLSISKTGFVEEFVEGENLSRLAQTDRAKAAEAMQTLGPALVKSFFLWPERYLDPQGGNLKAPAAIFDYGRMTLLAPRVNQTLNGISKACFQLIADLHRLNRELVQKKGAPKEEKKIEKEIEQRNQQFFETFVSLLQSLLNKNVKKEEFSEIVDKFLEGQYLKNKNDLDVQGRRLFQGEERDLKMQQSFFLGLFQNLAELSEQGKTIKLTEFGSPLTRQDVSHGREKLRAVMLPYFEYNQKQVSDAVLETWLKKEGAEKFGEIRGYLPKKNDYRLMSQLTRAYEGCEKAKKAVLKLEKELKPNLKKNPEARPPKERLEYLKQNIQKWEAYLENLKQSSNADSDEGRAEIENAKQGLKASQQSLKNFQDQFKHDKNSLEWEKKRLKRHTDAFADLYQRAMRDGDARQTLIQAVRWDRQLATLAESVYTDLMKGVSIAKEQRPFLIGVLKNQLYCEYQPTVRDDEYSDDDD